MNRFVNSQAPDQAGQAKYFNGFNLIGGIGPVSFKKLLNHFKSLEYAWKANQNKFEDSGLNKNTISQIIRKRPQINLDSEMEKLDKEKVHLITILDKNYPYLLKEIYNPPALLYVRGNLDLNNPGIGVVGTRKLSSYGEQITPAITNKLIQKNLTIISGLAKGIDTLSHKTAVLNKGKTIAVLGAGVDKKSIYPKSNQYLAEKIIENGSLISEYPLGALPSKQSFPQRNRIISGLSLGVLVIEAPEKSGAMITARNALEQNREVFAVPGDISHPNSRGPHKLIKMGAKLVNSIEDITDELNLSR